MDLLEGMVCLLVLYIAVLFPLAGWLWEYVRPWAKALWMDWREFRKQRRIEQKRIQYTRWKEANQCQGK
jgi:hypothetical protein